MKIQYIVTTRHFDHDTFDTLEQARAWAIRHAEAILNAAWEHGLTRQAILTAVEAAMAEGAAMERAKVAAWLGQGFDTYPHGTYGRDSEKKED